MQKKINLLLLLAIVTVTVLFAHDAYAPPGAAPGSVPPVSTPGGASATIDEVYCDIRDLVRGSVGTIIGFLFALGGLVMLLLKGSNYGIVLIIIGISVTAFPGLINSVIVGMSTASSEADDITIGTCNSSGTLPSTNTISDNVTINAITRGSNVNTDTTLLPCNLGGVNNC